MGGEPERDMNERRFPTEEEVSTWLADLHAVSHASVADLDQAAAAVEETSTVAEQVVRVVANLGPDSWSYIGEAPTNPPLERLAARMLLAAMSAGITPFCPHVDQVRPLHVVCDPPSVVCTDCLATAARRVSSRPIRWQGQCDACGSPNALGFEVLLNFDHLLIEGNVCARCNRYL
jgi:hypothetical protein